MRKFAIIIVCLLFLGVVPARAQDEVVATLSLSDTAGFPVVTASLDVHRSGGEFVGGLDAGQLVVVEHGEPLPVDELQEIEQGVEWIVAVNAGSPLAIRDSEGVARYDRIVEVLRNWTAAEPASDTDVFSWFASGASPAIRLNSRSEWRMALETYLPDFRNSTPSLESLLAAVDLAESPPPQPGMERGILWITPPLEAQMFEAVDGLIERVRQSRTRIYVWMVASPGAFESDGAAALQRLAGETHGQFVPYSGDEALPDPEGYLAPLRGIYSLKYTSAVHEGGAQTVAVRISLDGAEWTSAEQTFDLSIMPPNPMFLSPPGTILRTCPADSKQPLDDLKPRSHTIQALIEFPDGHHRDLARTRYYVDGVLAEEKSEPPFDEFEWDLRGYTASGPHTLRVEAEDQLGMSKSSLEIPVEVIVQIPPASLWTTILRNRTVLYTGAVVLAGLCLTLVLFLAGRWKAHAAALRMRRPMGDPLTQPVRIAQQGQLPDAVDHTAHSLWPRRSGAAPGASLIRLGADHRPVTGAPVAITGREMSIGRDPTRATCVLDSSSVDGLHARLRLTPDGSYVLSDQDSVAGTWVNYAPVSADGARLEHGDIIHIGQVAFRFVLNKPGHTRKPVVQPYREDQ